jgi:histidine triad (HIT) family protein
MAASCVFCAVLAGGDRETIYRDERVAAFLDHAPVVHGHTLVVTTQHYDTIEHVPDALLAPLFGLVQKVSRAFGPALGAEGSLTLSNTRISQSVPHVHIHVVPRRKGDGLFSPGRPFWMRQKYGEGQAAELTAKLRAALAH